LGFGFLTMGLFDRLLGGGSREGAFSSKKPKQEKRSARKEENAFFLDADAASTLGNVEFMRRPNTIRHTFPGNADSPGVKEIVQDVDSMQAKLEKASSGLPGTAPNETATSLTGGVPKQVKKTFAEKISTAQLSQRLKGSAVGGVNVPGAPAGSGKAAASAESQPQISQQPAKPGAIDPFKDMAKDLTV
jgi:hypothetical protein